MHIYFSLVLQHKDHGEGRGDHSRIFAAPFMSVYFRALGPNMIILDLAPWPVEHTLRSRATTSSPWVNIVGAVLKWAKPMDIYSV